MNDTQENLISLNEVNDKVLKCWNLVHYIDLRYIDKSENVAKLLDNDSETLFKTLKEQCL